MEAYEISGWRVFKKSELANKYPSKMKIYSMEKRLKELSTKFAENNMSYDSFYCIRKSL